MSFLINTNVLLRSIQNNHPMHEASVYAIQSLLQQEEISIVCQNLIEFWAVATRPINANGLGLDVVTTTHKLAQLKTFFTLQPDTPDIFFEWEKLVFKYQVVGKQVHDTRLVAAMIAHRITHLLTFNVDDFKRFSEIEVVDPRNIHAL
jgi:predicted nucleic acid-binding protein